MGRRILGYTAAGLALGAVFLAYLKPDMAFTLAQQVWSCF